MTRLLATLIAVFMPTASASAAPREPRLTEPRAERLAALECHGDLKTSPRPPVLLVPGTITTPDETWSWGYRKLLLERGHGVCTVALPDYGFGDAQHAVEYVVTAIRVLGRRSSRRFSIVGFSQGGLLAVFALRVWPTAASHVDDLVGLAGVYDRGSEWARREIDPATRTTESHAYCSDACAASLTQEASGSNLHTALATRRLPAGLTYTAVGTRYDEQVTPQPEANELPPAAARRSVQIQDICPGRRYPSSGGHFPVNHASLLGDAVAHALVLDALDHPGPADPSRVSRAICLKTTYDGVDWPRFAAAAPDFGPRSAEPEHEVEEEPALRCNLAPECADRRSWAAPLLESVRVAETALTVRVRAAGWLRLRPQRRGGSPGRRVRRHTIRLRRGDQLIPLDALRGGSYRVRLETKPLRGGYWTRERAVRIRGAQPHGPRASPARDVRARQRQGRALHPDRRATGSPLVRG